MLQAKFYDFIIGIDFHMVEIPAPPSPKPIPTPVPMPHLGIIFDPVGLAIGAAISQALSGNPGNVLINGMPVANCGTNTMNRLMLPHVFAPGIAFSMGVPLGNAELYFGSQGVSLQGSYGVRMGDAALTCSDPVRLPTSTVLSIPAGYPVLNMKPSVPDVKAIATAAIMRGVLRGLGAVAGRVFRVIRRAQRSSRVWEGIARRAHNIIDSIAPQRLRQALHRNACRLTGHPVDVATGRVLTWETDLELPGPLPVKLERNYDSSLSFRDGPLGYGWSHSLDQSVWTEPEKVIYQAEDGREIEFQLYDEPNMELAVDETTYQPIERLTLKNLGEGRWEITDKDGTAHLFGPVIGRRKECPLLKKTTRDGHVQEHFYNGLGLLERVRDVCGRDIGFTYDERGYLSTVRAPNPRGGAPIKHRRFEYTEEGDLAKVTDALGKSWTFEYDGHLLVQETDRTGLSFYFQYDGRGPYSWCVRTWGDGGIYDHEIDYDKINKITTVTNSTRTAHRYDMNQDGLVVGILDEHSHYTTFEYDERSFQLTAEIDPLGRATRRAYDDRGNLISVTFPDGYGLKLEIDPILDVPVRAMSTTGGEWRFEHDRLGHLTSRVLPTGETTSYEWEKGLVRAVTEAGDRRTTFAYDRFKSLTSVRLANDAEVTCIYDGQGRLTRLLEPTGGETRTSFDLEGRTVEVTSPTGVTQYMRYDAEGNLIEAQDETRHVKMRYAGFHALVEREEAGSSVRFEYDGEHRLTKIINEAGEEYTFVRDATGHVRHETGFDGVYRYYHRNEANQVRKILTKPKDRWTALDYDDAGRLASVKYPDGTSETYEYGPNGAIRRAANDEVEVVFETDELGRIVREQVGDVSVSSVYGPDGSRILMESSLGARQAVLYDALGEVESLHHGPVDAFWRSQISIGRNPLGAEVSRSLPGGVEVHWELDKAHRPTSRRTLQKLPGARSVELDAKRFQWRGEDQIAAIIDAARGPTFYTHDTRGRLIGSRKPGGTGLFDQDDVVHRVMDEVGNIFRSPDMSDRQYELGGRIAKANGTSYRQDVLGNVTQKIEADGSLWQYHWNGAGMLKEVVQPDSKHIGYEYDVFGRRTKKTIFEVDESHLEGPRQAFLREALDMPPWEPINTIENETRYVWDGDHVIHEVSSDEGLTTWYWQPGTFMPVAKERGKLLWSLAHDQIGTPTAMYDEAGNLIWGMELDIYGEPTFRAGEARDCPWRWPGQFEDAETGLYYNRFRYFDSRTGRFTSQDPLLINGGIHFYNYADDLLLWIDPLGLVVRPGPGEPLYVGPYGTSARANPRTNVAEVPYTPHHVVQNAVSTVSGNGVSHGQGASINIPRSLHLLTRTYGSRRPPMPISQHLLQDAIEMRILLTAYGFDSNQVERQVAELVRMNEDLHEGKLGSCK